MRCALKFAYDGTAFHGYQRQPVSPTVEGELVRAMQQTRMIRDPMASRFRSASRTDRGVSALGNVCALDTEFKKGNILKALNSKIENIWVYGIAEVPGNFNPRHASQRWYRYLLRDRGYDVEGMRKCSELFLGEHDFRNFSRGESNPTRRIDEISVVEDNDFILLDFRAPNFLWNMVRRLVSAMQKVGGDEIAMETVKTALRGSERVDLGLATPENLILMDITYRQDIRFETSQQPLDAVMDMLDEKVEFGKFSIYLMKEVTRRFG